VKRKGRRGPEKAKSKERIGRKSSTVRSVKEPETCYLAMGRGGGVNTPFSTGKRWRGKTQDELWIVGSQGKVSPLNLEEYYTLGNGFSRGKQQEEKKTIPKSTGKEGF